MWKTILALSLCGTLVAGAEEMIGKLVIPPEAHTKESFRTGNFQLWTASSKLILTESSRVPADRLTGFRNRRVKVNLELIPAQPADPGEQAPLQMAPDGTTKLEDHPASYRVLSIQAAP